MDTKGQIDAIAKYIREVLVGMAVPEESLGDVAARLVMQPAANGVPKDDDGAHSVFYEDGKVNVSAVCLGIAEMKKTSPHLFHADRYSQEQQTMRQLDAANRALTAKGSPIDHRQKALNALIAARKPKDFDTWSPERQLAFCNRVELEMDGIVRPECAD